MRTSIGQFSFIMETESEIAYRINGLREMLRNLFNALF